MKNILVLSWIMMLGGAIVFADRLNAACNTHEIDQAVAKGNFDTALKATQRCIDSSQADVAATKSPSMLAETNLGAFLIAKAEILALKGDLFSADAALADAEAFDKQHPRSTVRWSANMSPLDTARGFVLEKKNDLKGAAEVYEAVIKQIQKDGYANSLGDSSELCGRVALTALQRGDDVTAEKWAKKALSQDAGANVALAMLYKKRGDAARAKEYYAAALKLMNDHLGGNNWTLPIFYAEYKRATDGDR